MADVWADLDVEAALEADGKAVRRCCFLALYRWLSSRAFDVALQHDTRTRMLVRACSLWKKSLRVVYV
ncbi:hypothetical protein EON66_04080 [archaeon]|nr:MAG: hypothetical protein EON66_04080 [archaeon]